MIRTRSTKRERRMCILFTGLLVATPLIAFAQVEQAAWEAYDPETLEPGLRPYVRLPLGFAIADSCLLFVNYSPIEYVSLEWDPAGKLLANGFAILGAPDSSGEQKRAWTEAELKHLYGSVPFVKQLRETGTSWRQSCSRYDSLRQSIRNLTEDTFYELVEQGVEPDSAAARAAAIGLSADSAGLFGTIVSSGTVIKYMPRGFERLDVVHRPPYERPAGGSQRSWSKGEARARATLIYENVGPISRKPGVIFTDGYSFQMFIGSKKFRRIRFQIDEAIAHPDVYVQGPLTKYMIGRILGAKGVGG